MALDLNDKTANNNDLTNNGASEYTADTPFVQSTIAADLELSEADYFSAADSASLSITGNLTIELWVKFESLPATNDYSFFVHKFSGGGQSSYSFRLINNGGTLQLNFIFSTDGSYQGANDKTVNWTPSTGVWYHVAVTYATAPEIKFYVDGSQQGTTQTPTGTTIFDGTSTVYIGSNENQFATYFMDGVIDDIRIWNTVRTGTQINDNKSIELVGNESGLVAYWPFEATLGTTTSTSSSTSTTSTSTSSSTSTTSTSTSSSTSSSTTSTSTSSSSSTTSTSTSSSSSTSTSSSTSSSTSTSTTTTWPYTFTVDSDLTSQQDQMSFEVDPEENKSFKVDTGV